MENEYKDFLTQGLYALAKYYCIIVNTKRKTDRIKVW